MSNPEPKVALITGAYGAIGFAIAKKLALEGMDIILVGKNERRLEEAVYTIQKLNSDANVWFEVVDLSSKQSIINLAERWEGPLHLLINNACTTPRQRFETSEGIEVQFAVNVLGYFRMTHYFSEFMKNSQEARIVNVASYWAGGLDLSDLEFRTRTYDNDAAYRQSKQANRMLSKAFSNKLRAFNIQVNSCHPGDVNSKLSNNLGFGGHQSPEEGADTPVWLAVNTEDKYFTGKYFEQKNEVFCHFSNDSTAVDELFSQCEKYL